MVRERIWFDGLRLSGWWFALPGAETFGGFGSLIVSNNFRFVGRRDLCLFWVVLAGEERSSFSFFNLRLLVGP